MGVLTDNTTETHRKRLQMSLHQGSIIPLEIFIAIADHLSSDRDIIAFGLTCQDLYTILVKKQRRSLEIDLDGSLASCLQLGGPRYRLLNQTTALLTIPGCLMADPIDASCSYWGLAKKRVAVNQLFTQDDSKLLKSIKELTLSGWLSYGSATGYSLTSHPFLQSGGFKAIRPEIFKVDISWDSWDFDILHGMSAANLKVLKLPIHLPSDCILLGQALTNMPRLASLTITDIPDRDEFLTGLEHIGKGIMSCASTLRELDIGMTNFNRPASWDRDERFTEPEDNGFFFRKLFPCPQKAEEHFALFDRHSQQAKKKGFVFFDPHFQHDPDPMVEAPLSLTKLRLKHVSLPWYSFGIIFNATSIKHLNLPYSMVDKEVWRLLKTYARLDTLTGISYDMLSKGFLDFLKTQSSLKELIFARPQDKYDAANIIFYNDIPHMTICISKEAPRLGPDTGAEYPSLDDFLSSLEHMTRLKHLVLPADMYTITRDCLLFIAAWLTGLEHLEFGFDYNDLVLQQMFATIFLWATTNLKKITFFSLKQPKPLPDFDTAQIHALLASLGDSIPANLKLVRYMPLIEMHSQSYWDIEVYYHRETPVDGEWWMQLPRGKREQIFAEGRTPEIVPVGKWNWETEAAKSAHEAGPERRAFREPRAK